jgi:hypothetical protein
MWTVYARVVLSSSVWGGRVAKCAGHNGEQAGPLRTNHNQAFGLQNGCRTRSGRSVRSAISLEITGGRTWIRTTDLFLIREAL